MEIIIIKDLFLYSSLPNLILWAQPYLIRKLN